MRVDYALRQHEQWYKGDGAVRRRPGVPLGLLQQLRHPADAARRARGAAGTRCRRGRSWTRASASGRARYAAIQERLIAPDGTFPAIGRSIAYRFGAFHLLAQIGAAARAAGRCRARAGPRRADRRHPADDRRARHVRRRRLAADRLLRPPAGGRRNLHLDRQPVSVRGRPAAARPARRRTSSGRARRSRGRRCARGQDRRFRSTTPSPSDRHRVRACAS